MQINTVDAMRQSLELAKSHDYDNMLTEEEGTDFEFLLNSLRDAECCDPDQVAAKFTHSLGWMQACLVCFCDEITLEDIQDINFSCKL